jgi:uncharacterized MnhB-related membrane protein
MTLIENTILILVCISAPGVVFTTDSVSQAIAVSFYGILLGIMFFIFKAPDVALSQIVIGAVVLPLMILLALARINRDKEEINRRNKNEANQNDLRAED